MRFTNEEINTLLDSTRRGFSNAKDHSDLTQRLSEFGFDETRLDNALVLLETTQASVAANQQEYANQIRITDEVTQEMDMVLKMYTDDLSLARSLFRDNPGAQAALGLNGRRKRKLRNWTSQARSFYDNAMSDQSYLDKLAELGLAAEKLQEHKDRITGLLAMDDRQENQKGLAQRSTAERDAKVAQLMKEWSAFRIVSRVVFREDRQNLERLGIRAYSTTYKKKKTETTDDTGTTGENPPADDNTDTTGTDTTDPTDTGTNSPAS